MILKGNSGETVVTHRKKGYLCGVLIFCVMEKSIVFTTQGTCSKEIDVVVENGLIKHVEFVGGCHGNTQGIAALVKGMSITEAISRLEGIDCRGRGTSCPDQLTKALRKLV
jgi:uncharacterized protein (TIGR03905 family)